jgi:hypothetical protein
MLKTNNMLRKATTAVLLAVLSSLLLTGQEQLRIPPGISGAFKTGNSPELSKYFNSTVQIMLIGKEDFYKKNVAETIVRDFFAQYRCVDFIIKHQGGTADAQYAIGKLKTDKGEFRVYFLLKKVGNELLIHQLRIEPDDGK